MRRGRRFECALALAGCLSVLQTRTLTAQSWTDKLSIHAYLTQGAAKSDTGVVIGIPKDGTTDYRRVALLLRYAVTTHDRFVLQIANRELGMSPTQAFEPQVKLDWAFYEHQFGDILTVRVGQAPIPIGIYNEIRYVGTLLPFYRAPFDMYQEGSYTSETIDGAVVSHTFLPNSPWHVETQAYAGTFHYVTFSSIPDSITGVLAYIGGRAQAQDVLGGQIWLSTPLDGLRVGGGGMRFTAIGNPFDPPTLKTPETTWQVSLDGTFDRFQVRSEYGVLKSGGFTQPRYYVQAGARVWGPITVNGQLEYENKKDTEASNLEDIAFDRDHAIGVNYAVLSNIVVKLEGHFTKGYNYEMPISSHGPPIDGRYAIASVSVAF